MMVEAVGRLPENLLHVKRRSFVVVVAPMSVTDKIT